MTWERPPPRALWRTWSGALLRWLAHKFDPPEAPWEATIGPVCMECGVGVPDPRQPQDPVHLRGCDGAIPVEA
jgi:hypothetical protein